MLLWLKGHYYLILDVAMQCMQEIFLARGQDGEEWFRAYTNNHKHLNKVCWPHFGSQAHSVMNLLGFRGL